MKKALILTLGFDEKFCYRAITRHRISEGDKIILITATLVEKVRKAYEWIKAFINTSYNNVEVRLVELDVKDIFSSLGKVSRIFNEYSNYNLIVNLSGGMRILSFIVLFSIILSDIRNLKLEIELEDFSGVMEIPVPLLSLPMIKASIGKEKLAILKLIKEGKNDVKSISKALNKDESTIRRHLQTLHRLGLIDFEKKKPLIIKGTKLLNIIFI